jgi:hypothetical protein
MRNLSFGRLVRGGVVASCLVVTLPAAAVVVGTRVLDADPDGNAVNALMNGFRLHADALSARYIDRANQGIAPATQQTWQAFERRLRFSTFVTLIYTYQRTDGVAHMRTYYAMSGSRGSVETGPESLLTPDLADWLDPWPGEVMATRQDDTRTRVPWQLPTIRPEAPWDLQDAEIKAIRTLEKDLADGVVGTGGLATVFVSGPVCLSCSQALNNFANAYELSLVVNENLASGSQTNHLYRARQAAYLATVRSSLIGRERFRPTDAPPRRGAVPPMCVLGRPVVAFPVALRPPAHSALIALVRAYARRDGNASYVLTGTDESFAQWELQDPSSPYSVLAVRDLSPMTDAERFAAESFAIEGHIPGQHELHERKQRELGYTKSRPWTDVVDEYGAPINAIRGVPSHVKAGVESDILIAVRDEVGRDYPAIGALYAVALQLLREKLDATPVADQRKVGLRKEALGDIQTSVGRWQPAGFDRQYLAILLDGEMREWNIGPPNDASVSPLPVPFRVARMAAAYRDQQPYSVDPCLNPREHNPATAGKGGDDPRPLCFNDATDRAVYAWFVAELRREMAREGAVEFGQAHLAEMLDPFRYTQFGPLALATGSLASAVRKEVVEMKVVNRVVADGDLSYEASLPVIRRAVDHLLPKRN